MNGEVSLPLSRYVPAFELMFLPLPRAGEVMNTVVVRRSTLTNMLYLVVVRTGDHTLIGGCARTTSNHYRLTICLGQIAKLTGGETGNQSPLAIEMYVFDAGNGHDFKQSTDNTTVASL